VASVPFASASFLKLTRVGDILAGKAYHRRLQSFNQLLVTVRLRSSYWPRWQVPSETLGLVV